MFRRVLSLAFIAVGLICLPAISQDNRSGTTPGDQQNPTPGQPQTPPVSRATERPDTTGDNLDRQGLTQTDRSTGGQRTASNLDPPRQLQRASQLMGGPITRNGRNIGRMEDMMVDVHSGRITYGINSFNNVSGASGNFFPVPWGAGRFSDTDNAFEMDIQDEQLRSAPSFPRAQWPNFDNDEFATRTFRSYNQTPWWESSDRSPSGVSVARMNNAEFPGSADAGNQTAPRTDDRNARTTLPPGQTVTDRDRAGGGSRGGTVRDANNADRNGTRGSDVPGSERVVGGTSRDRTTTPGRNEAGQRDSTTVDRNARTARDVDNRTAADTTPGRDTTRGQDRTARSPAIGTSVRTSAEDTRDRFSRRPTGLRRMSEIRGSQILAADGTRVGTIDELVVDPQNGRLNYVVTGAGDRRLPIPWSALRPGTGNNFELTVDAAKLRDAPSFNPDRWPTMTDRTWSEDLHRFYTVRPYWDNDPASQGTSNIDRPGNDRR